MSTLPNFFAFLYKVCCKVLQQCPPSVSEALLHQWRVISCSVWPQADEAAWPHGCHPPFPPEWLCQVSNALGLESLRITAAHQRCHGPMVCTCRVTSLNTVGFICGNPKIVTLMSLWVSVSLGMFKVKQLGLFLSLLVCLHVSAHLQQIDTTVTLLLTTFQTTILVFNLRNYNIFWVLRSESQISETWNLQYNIMCTSINFKVIFSFFGNFFFSNNSHTQWCFDRCSLWWIIY